MDDNFKIKGISKGTKGRKDKNKQSIYSSKHIRNQNARNQNARNQIQHKTTTDTTKEKGNSKENEKKIKNNVNNFMKN
jgi:hypothetical protein